MTVSFDLNKAIESAQSAKELYLRAAETTEDPSAKINYQQMAMDIESHISYLDSRVSYFNPIT